MRDCFAGAAAVLVATDYADACPIETVALEVASSNETLRIATAEVFEIVDRQRLDALSCRGPRRRDARASSAIAFINLLEGAFILCRASRTTEALEVAGKTAAIVVEAALAAAGSPHGRV